MFKWFFVRDDPLAVPHDQLPSGCTPAPERNETTRFGGRELCLVCHPSTCALLCTLTTFDFLNTFPVPLVSWTTRRVPKMSEAREAEKQRRDASWAGRRGQAERAALAAMTAAVQGRNAADYAARCEHASPQLLCGSARLDSPRCEHASPRLLCGSARLDSPPLRRCTAFAENLGQQEAPTDLPFAGDARVDAPKMAKRPKMCLMFASSG